MYVWMDGCMYVWMDGCKPCPQVPHATVIAVLLSPPSPHPLAFCAAQEQAEPFLTTGPLH